MALPAISFTPLLIVISPALSRFNGTLPATVSVMVVVPDPAIADAVYDTAVLVPATVTAPGV